MTLDREGNALGLESNGRREKPLGIRSVQPVFMRRVNGWLTIFWLVMIPISLATGWVKRSVVYVSAPSLWALVSGHCPASQAARVEVNQEAETKGPRGGGHRGDVVERVIAETDVKPA